MASDNSFYIGIPAFGAQVPINYDSSCPRYIQITGISQSVEYVGTYYDYTMELVDPSSLTSNTYIIHYSQKRQLTGGCKQRQSCYFRVPF